MFKCKHCNKEQDDNFLVQGYKTRCKSCDKTIRGMWAKKDKQQHPEKYRDRMRDYRKSSPKYRELSRQRSNKYNSKHREERLAYQVARQAERKVFINSFKDAPCKDCGQKYPTFCMDFDHVRGEKKDNIANMKSNRTFKRIQEEIEKCDLVCAICHRVRTQNRIDSGLETPLSL